MKKFLKQILIFSFALITAQSCYALEKVPSNKVLVLPDNLQLESTNYFIYPDSSVMFATDIINNFKKEGKIEAVSASKIRTSFRDNQRLRLLAKNVLKEYKYNYNVCYTDAKTLAKAFSVNKILLITSTTDVQNYFLRRTVWDFLNIPGATVIDPAYKISTYVVLVDVDKEEILWQKTFQKTISTNENRIVALNFAPATEQLERIKFYSEYILSPQVSNMVQFKLAPPIVPTVADKSIVPVSNIQSDILQNIELIPTPEITSKPFVPVVPRAKNVSSGTMVNDL